MASEKEYPKWVVPHETHVLRKSANGAPDHVSTPDWPDFHVARDGEVTVLVKDESGECKALDPVRDEAADHARERDAAESAERAEREAAERAIIEKERADELARAENAIAMKEGE